MIRPRAPFTTVGETGFLTMHYMNESERDTGMKFGRSVARRTRGNMLDV